MNRTWAIVFVVMIWSNASMADVLREANGKSCFPTERTYFKDGVPVYCAPAGGPAYSFDVYAGNSLIWSGELPANKPSVYFDLPGNNDKPLRLVFKRDLEASPSGYVLRFAESKTAKISQFKAGENVIYAPETEEVGVLIPVESGKEVNVHVGILPGAVISNDYRVIARSK